MFFLVVAVYQSIYILFTFVGGYQPTDGTRDIKPDRVLFYVTFFVLYFFIFIGGISFSIITCICKTNKSAIPNFINNYASKLCYFTHCHFVYFAFLKLSVTDC